MSLYPDTIERLIESLAHLPGVGRKTAVRLAFHLINSKNVDAQQLAESILEARNKIRYCSLCGNYTEEDPCHYCTDAGRDDRVLCVVEDPRDVAAMERTREYRGRYHVLHGAISPLDGVGPDDIRVKELLQRIQVSAIPVEEIIMATNPTIEGEATAMYISRLLKPLEIRVTRIAHGIPVGGDLEYADEVTLMKALEGRRLL